MKINMNIRTNNFNIKQSFNNKRWSMHQNKRKQTKTKSKINNS